VLIEGNYILTNGHVVWPYSEARIAFPDGSEFEEVPVHGWDLTSDTALLGPIDTNTATMALGDGEDIEIGGQVFLSWLSIGS